MPLLYRGSESKQGAAQNNDVCTRRLIASSGNQHVSEPTPTQTEFQAFLHCIQAHTFDPTEKTLPLPFSIKSSPTYTSLPIPIYTTTITTPSQRPDFYSSVAGGRSSTYACFNRNRYPSASEYGSPYPPTSTFLFIQLWGLVDKSDAAYSHAAQKAPSNLTNSKRSNLLFSPDESA